ncbi:MAG: prepilin-type N-terminal cleavage/methylation domain-containing protein [Fimbriimonas sp.]|nr:prepilin-type N-terminal cleavage/methylation domain-containing protein [Fimbriimonas sp.]
MKSSRKGFTLIELLVVIAIIAILAAILFPVFAQAKAAAKKAQAISNVKNMGTATELYNTDNDDTYGLATPFLGGTIGQWSWDRFLPVPQLIKTTTNVSLADGIRCHINNAMQPYIKNWDIFQDPFATRHTVAGTSVPNAVGIVAADYTASIPSITYTFNGLLQSMSSTAVAAPASLTTWWNGQGKRSLIGLNYSSPQLICTTPGADCRYVPATSSACSGNGGYSFYTSNASLRGWDMYTRNHIYAYADTHAKTRKSGVYENNKRQDPRSDPFAFYLGQEVDRFRAGGARYWDQFYCHPYLFRPDFDFATWDQVLVAP